MLRDRYCDMIMDMYACFFEYERALKKVQHGMLLELLMNRGSKFNRYCSSITGNLYWKQKSCSENQAYEKAYVTEVSSHNSLFYFESIFTEAFADSNDGTIISGQVINNI